jgi:DNA-directed RNA polymerase specialized sigma subunit
MPLSDYKSDSDAVTHWQKTRDPQLLGELMMRFQPAVHSVSGKYKTSGMSPAAIYAVANANVIKALNSYDPTKNTVPTTHVWNHLQKVQRGARESLLSGSIPEHRSLKLSTYQTVRQNLTDSLGYEPTTHDMADELSWSPKEVERMEKELGGETTASGLASDFYGNSTAFEHKDMALANYMYHELDPRHKIVFEHTFGYGGKPILNNKEIAKKLGTYEMDITRMKRKMGQKIIEAR